MIGWLTRFRDHPFSFVDGVSFAVMADEGLPSAFAFDHHFAVAGFLRVPTDCAPGEEDVS